MSRVAEDASTPAYQVLITVRSRPNARIATATASTVSVVLSLCLKAFLKIIFHRIIR